MSTKQPNTVRTVLILVGLIVAVVAAWQLKSTGDSAAPVETLAARLTRAAALRNDTLLFEDFRRILLVRPAGSENIKIVRKFLTEKLEAAGFSVTLDTFTDSTPYGQKEFSNIIASRNPSAKQRYVFGAHYDSKYFAPPAEFLGATDSAIPCAILLDLARVIPSLAADVGIDIVFFDGEEAFKTWTETDSLYGARHLAAKWEKSGQLKKIRYLILLDLMGAKGSTYSVHYLESLAEFGVLADIEKTLRSSALLKTAKPMFNDHKVSYTVEDDQIPFVQRGVAALHVIATPFPAVWHTIKDDASAIDHETVSDLAAIFRGYVSGLRPL